MVYHDDVLLGNYSLTHTYQSHNVISLLADNDRNQAMSNIETQVAKLSLSVLEPAHN